MGEIAALSASAVWAVASLLFALLGRTLPAATLNLLKCSIALALLWATMLLVEGTLWPAMAGADLALLAVSGFIGLTVGDTAFFESLNRLGPRRAILLSSLVPPLTAIAGLVVLSEPFTPPMLLGMALTLGGVTWVIRERAPERDGSTLAASVVRAGVAFGVLGGVCQVFVNVITKYAGGDLTALQVSVVRLSFGVIGLGLQAAIRGRLPGVRATFANRRALAALLGATLLGTYLGVWLMNIGLLYAPVGIASTLNSTSPIFVLPLAVLVLREKVSARAVVGAVLAVGGVAVLFLT